MNGDQLEALRLLIEFARNVNYNDNRYGPKEINKACEIVETYLNKE